MENPQPQVVYKANKSAVQALKKTKKKAYDACMQCMNRYVRVETANGEMYEGQIVNVDNNYAYLAAPQQQRSPFYYNPITPLVLYDLLVISLLYS